MPFNSKHSTNPDILMEENFDVIIVGGSYAGLSAAMTLGRALRNVLVVDAGKPANRFTPHSHNFLTHDGKPPGEIAALARMQVDAYPTVKRRNGFVIHVEKEYAGFRVRLENGSTYTCRKLIFATGITDVLPDIPGFSDCWGKSVLHCPYCHGYEVRHEKTAILGNGDYAFEFGALISNWTRDLTIFTNGASSLTADQTLTLSKHNIPIVDAKIKALRHTDGNLDGVIFENGESTPLSVIYSRPPFKQHSDVPMQLGCELTEDGYIKTDSAQKTTVPGVFACGDNATRLRTVSNAVSLGTIAGIMVNKELVHECF
jgi:thioredoxin reductase